ncbi:HEAT repeat domain-containing protein [Candidatus Margulisiibacteriota bacterium]
MRLIEKEVGATGLNGDVATFVLSSDAGYRPKGTLIQGAIDVFHRGGPLRKEYHAHDILIRAEIGHWLFDYFDVRHNWASELMDRMNIAGYREGKITRGLSLWWAGAPVEQLSPEVRTFLQGGFYLQSGGVLREADAGYPVYPSEFSKARKHSLEKHEVAERIERAIRKRVIESLRHGEIGAEEVYGSYRNVGLYIAMTNFTRDKIFKEIEQLDLSEIAENPNDYQELYAFRLVGERKWDEAIKLGVKAVPAFEKALNHRSSSIRKQAAKALGRIGDKTAVPALERAINDRDNHVKKAAIYALGRIGDKTAIPALEREINDRDNDNNVNRAAVYARGRIEDEDAISTLERCLDDRRAFIRGAASEALIRIKGLREGAEAYLQLYAYQLIEKQARRTLNEWNWNEIMELGINAIPALVSALNDRNSFVSEKAAEIIIQMNHESATPHLTRLLDNEGHKVRGKAAKILLVIKKLDQGSQEYKNLLAYQFVGEEECSKVVVLGRTAAVPALEKVLGSKDDNLRAGAISAFGEIGTKEDAPMIGRFLDDENRLVRGSAAEALLKLENPRVNSRRYKRLFAYQLIAEGEWERVVKLGRMAVPALEKTLSDSDFGKVLMAAGALLKAKRLKPRSPKYRQLYAYQLVGRQEWREVVKTGKSTLPALDRALETETEENSKIQIIETLEQIGHKAAIPILEKALMDFYFQVRRKAAEVLLRLKRPKENAEEYRRLLAYPLVAEHKWAKVIELGQAALPALEGMQLKRALLHPKERDKLDVVINIVSKE